LDVVQKQGLRNSETCGQLTQGKNGGPFTPEPPSQVIVEMKPWNMTVYDFGPSFAVWIHNDDECPPTVNGPEFAGIDGPVSCPSSCCSIILGFCILSSGAVFEVLRPSPSALFRDGPGRRQTPAMV